MKKLCRCFKSSRESDNVSVILTASINEAYHNGHKKHEEDEEDEEEEEDEDEKLTGHINWKDYLSTWTVKLETVSSMLVLEYTSDENERLEEFKDKAVSYASTMLYILPLLQTNMQRKQMLHMINDLLRPEERDLASVFRRVTPTLNPIIQVLEWEDSDLETCYLAALILAKIGSWCSERLDKNTRVMILKYLQDRVEDKMGVQLIPPLKCLQIMLQISMYRRIFCKLGGFETMFKRLEGTTNPQIQYYIVFNIWVMTFEKTLRSYCLELNGLPKMIKVLSTSHWEKVLRVSIYLVNSLMLHPEYKLTGEYENNCIELIRLNMWRVISDLQKRHFVDEDLVEVIDEMYQLLEGTISRLGNMDFATYVVEVEAASRAWSVIERTKSFWLYNARHFTDNDNQVIKLLIDHMQKGDDARIKYAACRDLCGFIDNYPRGKHVVLDLAGKMPALQLLFHENAKVNYQALVTCQTLLLRKCSSCWDQPLLEDFKMPNIKLPDAVRPKGSYTLLRWFRCARRKRRKIVKVEECDYDDQWIVGFDDMGIDESSPQFGPGRNGISRKS